MFTRKFPFCLCVVLCVVFPICAWAETVQISGISGDEVDQTILRKAVVLTELFLKENGHEVVEKNSSVQAVVRIDKNNTGYVIELNKKVGWRTIHQEKRIVSSEENLDLAVENLVNKVFEKKADEIEFMDNEDNVSASSNSSDESVQNSSFWFYHSYDFGFGTSLMFLLFHHEEMAHVPIGAGFAIRFGVNYAIDENISFPIKMDFAKSTGSQAHSHLSLNAGVRFFLGKEKDFFLSPFIGLGFNDYNEPSGSDDDDNRSFMSINGYNLGLEGGYRFLKWNRFDISSILSYEATVDLESSKTKVANTISALIQFSFVSGR